MSEPNDMNADAQDADVELDLGADELRALAVACASRELQRDFVTRAAKPLVNASIPPARSASPSRAHASRSLERLRAMSRFGLPLGLVIAVIGVSALYAYLTAPGGSRQPSMTTLTQSAAQQEWAAPELHGEPVHFANPFDASEVFEFPPGTTEAEAREAVADFLIERAMSRQAHLGGLPKQITPGSRGIVAN
jgi:hypothetical protein